MRKLIGKIRRQPKQRRDNIALGIASGCTFLVAAFWLFNVPDTFSGLLSAEDTQENSEAGFFDSLSSQAAAVKESFAGTDTATESLKELMNEYRASSTEETSESSTSPAPVRATSTATTTPPVVRPRFTTDSAYESEKPQTVRIQTVATSSTSTTPNE